jgi:hypothetical protein
MKAFNSRSTLPTTTPNARYCSSQVMLKHRWLCEQLEPIVAFD